MRRSLARMPLALVLLARRNGRCAERGTRRGDAG